MNELTLTSALLVGFLGSSHCLGMCGGLSAALGLNGQRSKQGLLLSYNLGRLCTYTAMGAVAGLFGEQLVTLLPQIGELLRTLAGLLLVAMGLYVSQWWMGLTRLEMLGAQLWRHLQPLTKSLLPVQGHGQALRLGVLWGLLPCGLVYSTLSWALAAAQWQQSALLMLAFGIGTLPAMLSVGWLNQQLLLQLRGKQFRVLAGLMIIAMGLLTMISPWLHLAGDEHSQHQHDAHRPLMSQ
jgi:sulfite exporter TauE/SafE